VGISQESQFDPTRVKKAEVVIKEMESAHGRQFATIRTEVRAISSSFRKRDLRDQRGPQG